eukprot:c15517_g1_i1.p1 GENE.c15517_g1_i1~~c15517_g1_i1.p1  ORF type:complete len:273 (+),score=47.94 c15517_g1_i1:29-847(+)
MGDLSPPRKRRQPDISPPRRTKREDLSPPRRSNREVRDLSPPRQIKQEPRDDGDLSPPRHVRREMGGMSPTRTGLRSAEQLRADVMAKRIEEEQRFANADPNLLGRNSATVYRDKSGKKLTAEELEKKRSQEGKARDPNEGKPEWGGGLVQRSERDRMKERLEEEKNSKFSRYADDEEMNDRLKQAVRWGDPMAAAAAQSQQQSSAKAEGRSSQVKRRRCPHAAIPNRFGIPPGYQWDGVDRSNGFEARVVQSKYDKQQRDLLAYRDGCEDM